MEDIAFEEAALSVCADALDHADYVFGRNTAHLGANAPSEQNTSGMWDTFAMPTFYHNGDGTRLAMLGTAMYMDLHIDTARRQGSTSPYEDRQTYLTTLITAAYDDIIFGVYGRGGDERASIEFARHDLMARGFSAAVINDVIVGIEASIFNEKTGKQNVDPARGAFAVQKGSTVGDLLVLGMPQAAIAAFALGSENLWKRDTAAMHQQILRGRALMAAMQGWQGNTFRDFLLLLDHDPVSKRAFGEFLFGNHTFILDKHRYDDPLVDTLMLRGKQESATLQSLLGNAIIRNHMSVSRAFHCAVSYAHAKRWETSGGTIPAALPDEVTPDEVSAALLTRRSIEDIQNPVDARLFYGQYSQEVATRTRKRVPRQRGR